MERLIRRTPAGKKAAQDHCKRCFAVLLCCVLVFGLTVPAIPRARAVPAVPAVGLLGGGVATAGAGAVTSTLGWLALAAVGVEFVSGYVNHGDSGIFYGTIGYDLGAGLWSALYEIGGAATSWCIELAEAFIAKGGVKAGDSFEIPSFIANLIRQWAKEHIDFTDGTAVYTDYGIFAGDTFIAYTTFDGDNYPHYNVGATPARIGTQVKPTEDTAYTYTFQNSDGVDYSARMFWSSDRIGVRFTDVATGTLLYAKYTGDTSSFCFYVVPINGNTNTALADYRYLSIGYFGSSGSVFACDTVTTANYTTRFRVDDLIDSVEVESTVSASEALYADTTGDVSADLTVTVPADVPFVDIGEWTVPVPTVVTADDVLNPAIPGTTTGVTAGQITQAITDALPITGSIAGDQVTEEVMTSGDSLGATFITKFPFSIPWDIAKAITLLARPPVTPRWEFDFLDPMADLVGGFPGDTTIVVDFSEYEIVGQVSRWLSTLMFVYALAELTKTYIWPA